MDYHPISTIFPLMEGEALDKLTQDIAENGLREPIVLLDGKILDGRNRYLACQKAAIKPEFTTYCGDSPLRYVLSLNLRRRHLTSSELSTVAVEALPWLEEEARKRQEATRAKPGEKIGSNVPATLPGPYKGESRDQVAALVGGTSGRQVSSAKAIKAKSPELYKEVQTGKLSIQQAERELRREEAIRVVSLPDAKYRVLYADPPWSYGNTKSDGSTEQRDHYPTMPLADICALPVAERCEPHAVLFLWVTSPILEESFQVVKAWGFKYKASFVWDKIRHNLGHYNSVRHEFLLICTRGSCHPDVPELIDSVQSIERTEHSRKPEEFRQIIDRLYPHGKRLELFAREAHEGWDTFGFEVP